MTLHSSDVPTVPLDETLFLLFVVLCRQKLYKKIRVTAEITPYKFNEMIVYHFKEN